MVTQTTALPPAPQRGDARDDFSDDADAFADALALFQEETNQQALEVNALALQAQAAAASAINAPGTKATSTTGLTIGTGTKTLTIQTGKAYAVGQPVGIAATASPTDQMRGFITAHDPATGALTVAVISTTGSGSCAAWTVALTGPVEIATVQDIWTGTSEGKVITPKVLFDANASQPAIFAPTLTLNMAEGINRHVTVTGNFTLANFINAIPGTGGRTRLTIGGAGGWAMTLPTSGSKFDPYGPLGLPPAAGARALLQHFVHDANTIELSMVRND